MHNVGLGAATETLKKQERLFNKINQDDPGLLPQSWTDEQAYERPSAMLLHRGADAVQGTRVSEGAGGGVHDQQTMSACGSRGSGQHADAGSPASPSKSGALWLSRRTQQSEHAFRLQVSRGTTCRRIVSDFCFCLMNRDDCHRRHKDMACRLARTHMTHA